MKTEHHKAVLFDCRDSGPDFFDIQILAITLAGGLYDPAGKSILSSLFEVTLGDKLKKGQNKAN